MKKIGICALIAASAMVAAQNKTAPVPRVIQGVVESISRSILVLRGSGSSMPGGRQVDVSSAVFENADGVTIDRQLLVPGDRILVVVDPSAPTQSRPPQGKPGQPRPMYIRLLPLKAMVVERLSPSRAVRDVTGKG